MELSKETLTELELFFEEVKTGDEDGVKIPFILGTPTINKRVILAIIEYTRSKLTRELEPIIRRQICVRMAENFVKLIDT